MVSKISGDFCYLFRIKAYNEVKERYIYFLMLFNNEQEDCD